MSTHYTFVRDWKNHHETRDPTVIVVELDHAKEDRFQDAQKRALDTGAESWQMTREEFEAQTRHVLVAFADISSDLEIEHIGVPLETA